MRRSFLIPESLERSFARGVGGCAGGDLGLFDHLDVMREFLREFFAQSCRIDGFAVTHVVALRGVATPFAPTPSMEPMTAVMVDHADFSTASRLRPLAVSS